MNARAHHNRDDLAAAAYGMFKSGMDTSQIAKSMKLRESQASRLVWVGRCWAKNRPAVYEDIRHGKTLQIVQTGVASHG